MNTEESNKLIAEFIGGELIANAYFKFDHNLEKGWLGHIHQIEMLKFHSSWDWLMPVVEKISDIEDGHVSDICFNHTSNYFTIEINTDEEMRTFEGASVTDSWIECAYKAVVEFIQWYNKQSKN